MVTWNMTLLPFVYMFYTRWTFLQFPLKRSNKHINNISMPYIPLCVVGKSIPSIYFFPVLVLLSYLSDMPSPCWGDKQMLFTQAWFFPPFRCSSTSISLFVWVLRRHGSHRGCWSALMAVSLLFSISSSYSS